MLEHLELHHVGPTTDDGLAIELAPRLNVLTGDNGLGKTFLLDIAWWALTRTWARHPATPRLGATKASISYRYGATTGPFSHTSTFDRQAQLWPPKKGRPPIPGMVLYAQVDGGFSVWDPARNYWKKESAGGPERPPAFLFSPDEVWNGLPRDEPRKLCNGLISDWASWQGRKSDAFEQLSRVLDHLSASESEPLRPGELGRISLDDVRDQPRISTPYGEDAFLVHASAGVRRIVALAYLLVWTWQEHLHACEQLGNTPAREIIFLIDELEAHLHPQWQRRIVPALMGVMDALTGDHQIPVQLIAATHSPLVLASLEPRFDPEVDALWKLDMVEGRVDLSRTRWRRRGDANAWLSFFDLQDPYSFEAEHALGKARELLRHHAASASSVSLDDVRAVDSELRAVLSDVDRFWVRWSAFVEGLEGGS